MHVGDDLPQLRFLLWNRTSPEVSEEEAFALYESNRAWVDPDRMNDTERALFEALKKRHGGGVFLG